MKIVMKKPVHEKIDEALDALARDGKALDIEHIELNEDEAVELYKSMKGVAITRGLLKDRGPIANIFREVILKEMQASAYMGVKLVVVGTI